MFKFYRDVVILFAIFFAYLMMAGRTKASERRITTEGII